jgi:hypothetical protein
MNAPYYFLFSLQNEDLLSTGKQWEEWIEGIEMDFRYLESRNL